MEGRKKSQKTLILAFDELKVMEPLIHTLYFALFFPFLAFNAPLDNSYLIYVKNKSFAQYVKYLKW